MRDLLSGIAIICQSPPDKGICSSCGEIVEGPDESHFCDPDSRIKAVMGSHQWRYLLKDPRRRARGYGVR